MGRTTEFWLNDTLVSTDDSEGLLLLDYVRKRQSLTGTKEGCKEGDCGACTVLVGDLRDDRIQYEPVTACLIPLGEMHGRHVVTVEGLNLDDLNPVQQAIVDNGGTQCGYCTPGFVVSMCWYVMCAEETPTLDGFQRAISGNLCRCTGYTSLNRASLELAEKFSSGGEWSEIWEADDRIAALTDAGMLPSYFTEMKDRLEGMEDRKPPRDDGADFVVAGGTDIYVQQGEQIPDSRVEILNHYPQMRGIRRENGEFVVGALTTFEEFAQHPGIRDYIPRIDEFMFLIASLQLRNRATLGGNIINASPIGDMTNFLLALDSQLVLRADNEERVVPMKEFFLDYKVLDRADDEILTEIVFPAPRGDTRVNFEKVAKRKALDIATVCSGFKIRVDDDGVIEHVNISVGGAAPIPLWLNATRSALIGEEVSAPTIRAALPVLQSEISPISDVRGSARYKRLLAQQLFIAHFAETFPDRVDYRDVVDSPSVEKARTP